VPLESLGRPIPIPFSHLFRVLLRFGNRRTIPDPAQDYLDSHSPRDERVIRPGELLLLKGVRNKRGP